MKSKKVYVKIVSTTTLENSENRKAIDREFGRSKTAATLSDHI